MSGFDYAACASAGPVAQAPVPEAEKPTTTSPYDVVEKTIGQLRADMESGVTTSQAITRAYLDRIAVYDRGQFGFNAYEYVATDAMAQAQAADAAPSGWKEGSAARHPDRHQESLRHQGHADDQRQPDVRGIPPRSGRLSGRQAARRRTRS